jgi:hypothetical protein
MSPRICPVCTEPIPEGVWTLAYLYGTRRPAYVHPACRREATIAPDACPAAFKLNCGCCAEIEEFGCNRKRGHKGSHRESVDNTVWCYTFEWKEVSGASDDDSGDLPTAAGG